MRPPGPLVVYVPPASGGVRNVTESLAKAFGELGVQTMVAHSLREVFLARLRGARSAILSLEAGLATLLFSQSVYILHGFPVVGWYAAPRRFAVRFVARMASLCGARMIAVSYLVRAIHERIFGIRVHDVILNGCSDEFHRLRSIDLPRRDKAVIFVGRWVPGKRVLQAAEAFLSSHLPSRGYSMRIVGSGPLEAKLRALASSSGSIEIVGAVDERAKAELMARTEILISLNDFEPMGVVFVEAMLSGCKIVAPHCGGHREFIPPLYPLFPCDPGSTASVAAALDVAAGQPVQSISVDAWQFDYRAVIAPAYLAALDQSGRT